ncbi:MAG: TetR/AcrR family transcriptional regulator [Oscillospiraceae bacterium]|nr:TetR/AcrR family transcriptional regulator [Oscillospiraceae bacterium]
MEQKKDLRIVKTQRALTESLKSLLLEKPLTEITVNELCERAMVRRATFYKHFGDKYELLTFTLKQMQGDISLARDSASPPSGSGGFYQDIAGMLDYIEANEPLVRALSSNCSTAAVSGLVSNFITHTIKDYLTQTGSVDSPRTAPLELLCQLLAGSLFYGISWWLDHKTLISKKEMAQRLRAFIVHGIDSTSASAESDALRKGAGE